MIRVEYNDAKWSFPFVAYLPEEYAEEQKGTKGQEKLPELPLVVQLHGAGERGHGAEELYLVDLHGFSKIMGQVQEKCMFVMPQCPADTFWTARVESLIAFIEQVIGEFPVDDKRVSLTGLSMGGFGTWYTAMAKPELFSAIAPHCGGGMAWNARMLDMPIWVFHGAADRTVSVNQSDEMVEKLRELGRDVRYTRLDGVGHAVQEYSFGKELLEWMLQQTRK